MYYKIRIALILVFHSMFLFSQEKMKQYLALTNIADSLYTIKEYKKSALIYNSAFRTHNGNSTLNHRYKIACAWALANYPDSSFYHLFRAALRGKYHDYQMIISDSSLLSLHSDKRWDSLIAIVNKNFQAVESKINRPVKKTLGSILIEDQKYRVQMEEQRKTFRPKLENFSSLKNKISEVDRLNLDVVCSILDKYGWLGVDEVGEKVNAALFLVIQHSKQSIQEKYLPLMKQAVKEGKANASSLALLEDRVLIGQGKKQIYGSQIGEDSSGKYYILPLEDPDKVDKRRLEVGLNPLAEYVIYWQIKWDIDDYKQKNKQKDCVEYKLKNFIFLNDMNDFISGICNEIKIKSKSYPMVLILDQEGKIYHYSVGTSENIAELKALATIIQKLP